MSSANGQADLLPSAKRAIGHEAGTAPSAPAVRPVTYRHIVVFSDGTGNSTASLFKTNVRRLYEALDLADPQFPEQPRQFALYDDGVGTSSFRPLALLGGAIGLGLARNVRDLYAFICRTYRDSDDKIFAFGFSRGAFTIRVLVGLIADQGLVPYDGDEANLDREVAKAYRRYRRKYRIKARQWLTALKRKPGQHDDAARNGSGQGPRIEFVGLWDTVDAYGLPIDELTKAVDTFLWPLTMPDYTLSEKVECARHAISLDDERNTFHPRLWNEDDSTGERLLQVWFAGVHANIGGGYADDSLAYVSLKWMMDEATDHGLRFSDHIRERYEALQDENGPIYDSRHGLGGYYRYNPRRVERLCDSGDVRVSRARIHESVLRRIKVAQDGYAPVAVPPDFDVVRIEGDVLPIDDYLAGLRMNSSNRAGSASFKDRYERAREHVWNWVWWRRVVYYYTLATTLFLAAFPLIWPALPKGACESRACFVADAIDWTTVLLPGFTSTWTDAFRSRPDIFLVLAALTTVGLWAGGRLQQRVRDAMRSVWYGIPELNPRPKTPDWAAKPVPPGWLNRRVEQLRQHAAYKTVFAALTRWLMPGAFMLALCYLFLALVSQTSFAIRSSWGGICASAGTAAPVTGRAAGQGFRTAALCTSTGLALEKGATYRLRIAIPVDDAWQDGGPWTDHTVPAGPNGVRPEGATFGMSAGVPLRRSLAQPWFKPIARIGSTGSDEYPLDPDPALAPGGDSAGRAFEARIVARSGGELFLYVNDAVLSIFPGLTSLFYAHNQGSGRVTVELLEPPPEPGAAPVGTQ